MFDYDETVLYYEDEETNQLYFKDFITSKENEKNIK